MSKPIQTTITPTRDELAAKLAGANAEEIRSIETEIEAQIAAENEQRVIAEAAATERDAVHRLAESLFVAVYSRGSQQTPAEIARNAISAAKQFRATARAEK